MCISHALINALSAHIIHINLNTRSCGSEFQMWGPKQEKVRKPWVWRLYCWVFFWSVCTLLLYLLASQVRVTVGDSGLFLCVVFFCCLCDVFWSLCTLRGIYSLPGESYRGRLRPFLLFMWRFLNFMYLVFTLKPGDSYQRRFRSCCVLRVTSFERFLADSARSRPLPVSDYDLTFLTWPDLTSLKYNSWLTGMCFPRFLSDRVEWCNTGGVASSVPNTKH